MHPVAIHDLYWYKIKCDSVHETEQDWKIGRLYISMADGEEKGQREGCEEDGRNSVKDLLNVLEIW